MHVHACRITERQCLQLLREQLHSNCTAQQRCTWLQWLPAGKGPLLHLVCFFLSFLISKHQRHGQIAYTEAVHALLLSQVPGCCADLGTEKLYCLRKRICSKHMQVRPQCSTVTDNAVP